MAIQKINFTSALLSKPQTQTLASKEVADKPISENQPQEENSVTEVIAEEAYFADSRRDGEAAGSAAFENTFGNTVSESSEFSVSSDDELPF